MSLVVMSGPVANDQIRNPWAHCNYSEWKATKFTDAFYMMEEMVKALPPNIDRVALMQSLVTLLMKINKSQTQKFLTSNLKIENQFHN